jgi:hypothetical protein
VHSRKDAGGYSGCDGSTVERAAVENYLAGRIVAEVLEVRPELERALALCRAHRAILLVAKLDRLVRNVAFVSALMEGGVEFVDFPQANRLTIHILAAAKARGVKIEGFRGRAGTAKETAIATAAGNGQRRAAPRIGRCLAADRSYRSGADCRLRGALTIPQLVPGHCGA